MDIAHELERARLLGTTRPTDEEIIEALKEADEECDDCSVVFSLAHGLDDDLTPEACEPRLVELLDACGLFPDSARLTARKFIETIKASVKTP